MLLSLSKSVTAKNSVSHFYPYPCPLPFDVYVVLNLSNTTNMARQPEFRERLKGLQFWVLK